MKSLSYSVVIRTLGTGGDKYAQLLKSIDNQTIKPKHIFIFIAKGYDLPKFQLGYEEFIRCEKGMWKQRIFGLEYVARNTDSIFQLVLDDDISFPDDFVEESLRIINNYDANILIPGMGRNGKIPYTEPTSFRDKIMHAFIGSRFEYRQSKWQIRITSTAGFIVNTDNSINVRETQSGPFACFIIRTDCICSLSLHDEYWIDETKYSLPDDQVFFFKAHCKGLKIINCKTPFFTHLDHGSSAPNRQQEIAISAGRNYIIFWHRFLYRRASRLRKLFLICSILYRVINTFIMYLSYSIMHFDFSIINAYVKGVYMGGQMILSNKYKSIPKI